MKMDTCFFGREESKNDIYKLMFTYKNKQNLLSPNQHFLLLISTETGNKQTTWPIYFQLFHFSL